MTAALNKEGFRHKNHLRPIPHSTLAKAVPVVRYRSLPGNTATTKLLLPVSIRVLILPQLPQRSPAGDSQSPSPSPLPFSPWAAIHRGKDTLHIWHGPTAFLVRQQPEQWYEFDTRGIRVLPYFWPTASLAFRFTIVLPDSVPTLPGEEPPTTEGRGWCNLKMAAPPRGW